MSCNDSQPAFACLLEALGCGAALLDRGGNVVHANARLTQMLQRTAVELRTPGALLLYRDRDSAARIDPAAAAEGEAFAALPEPDPGGSAKPGSDRLPVVFTARHLAIDSPLAGYVLVTLTDISRQKEAEEDLRSQYKVVSGLSDTILEQALALRDHRDLLEERVRQRTADLRDANLDAIFMLAVACEAKDHDTGTHVRRIQRYTRALARRVAPSESDADTIALAAVLHDVGKMHIPDDILQKPGPLTPAERVVMQGHTVAGERILIDRPFFSAARRIARSHHENWDGTGYPDGLAGAAIPLEARIVHVADVFDALTNRRVYKDAWSIDDAAVMIRESAGAMFDPAVVTAFTTALDRGELDAINPIPLDSPNPHPAAPIVP